MDNIFNQILEKMHKCLESTEQKHRIQKNVLDPFISYLAHRLLPYIISLSILLCLILIIVIYGIYLMVHLQRNIRLQNPS